MRLTRYLLPLVALGCMCTTHAESCTTQSQMTAQERATLVRVGNEIASLTAAGDSAGVRAQTMPQFANEFGGIQDAIHSAAPHLQGASFLPDSLWILDATSGKQGTDATARDTQFFCTLNRSASQTSFLIPALPAGRYAFAVFSTAGTAEAWQVAMLLRQSAPDTWQLGGLFPRATELSGHDGIWYWRAARDYSTKKQPWNAWAYYSVAESLLKPAGFISSTHLDSLLAERSKAAPSALSGGIGSDQPLVIAPAKGDEVRVTSLAGEKAPDRSGALDLLAHIQVAGPLADTVASRVRNAAAAKAIVAAYPELRTAFHGVWIVADLPGGGSYISEEPMSGL